MAEGEGDIRDLEWPTDRKAYELLNEIGDGASSQVFTALCKPLNKTVAVKIIDLDKTQVDIEEIRNELMVMKSCKHANLVSYYTTFVHQRQLWIVMRHLDRGSLLDVIRYYSKRQHGGVLDEQIIATVLQFVLRGLAYLHEQGEMHRDVKAGNILLHSDGTVQLADFGVSAFLGSSPMTALERGARVQFLGKKERKHLDFDVPRNTFVGTPCWMAPEVMEQLGYNEKADIWSLGITALELATGVAPYAMYDPLKVLKLTLEKDPPTLDTIADQKGENYSKYKSAFRKFVSSCLQKDPSGRPSAAELLKSDFIKKNARDSDYLVRELIEGLPTTLTKMKKMNETGAAGGDRDLVSGWDFTPANHVPQVVKDQVAARNARDAAAAAAAAAFDLSDTPVPRELLVTLRLFSDAQQELQDITFPMSLPADQPQTIAHEMVVQGLLREADQTCVTEALATLVNAPQIGQVLFPLSGSPPPEEEQLQKLQVKAGYAMFLIKIEPSAPAPPTAPTAPAAPVPSIVETETEDAPAAPDAPSTTAESQQQQQQEQQQQQQEEVRQEDASQKVSSV